VAKPRKKVASRGRIVFLSALALCAWALWVMPDGTFDPRELVSPEPSRARIFQTMRSDLERLRGREEEHYRARGEYTGTPADMGFSASEGIRVAIIATPSGWSGAATYLEYPADVGCAVYVGAVSPPRTPIRPDTPWRIVCTEG